MKMSIHEWKHYPLGKNYDTIVANLGKISNLDKNGALKEIYRK